MTPLFVKTTTNDDPFCIESNNMWGETKIIIISFKKIFRCTNQIRFNGILLIIIYCINE